MRVAHSNRTQCLVNLDSPAFLRLGKPVRYPLLGGLEHLQGPPRILLRRYQRPIIMSMHSQMQSRPTIPLAIEQVVSAISLSHLCHLSLLRLFYNPGDVLWLAPLQYPPPPQLNQPKLYVPHHLFALQRFLAEVPVATVESLRLGTTLELNHWDMKGPCDISERLTERSDSGPVLS